MPTASLIALAKGPGSWWLPGCVRDDVVVLGVVIVEVDSGATVTSGSVAGAEMMTFFAPADRCLAASSRLVKKPVDSRTTSIPRSPRQVGRVTLGQDLDLPCRRR